MVSKLRDGFCIPKGEHPTVISTPVGTLFYTCIPAEEGAGVEEGAGLEDVSLVYTGTLGVDDEVPVLRYDYTLP